ncbi:MAG TPA: helix-turn-helix domain-containing protein, partial [Woeseiaceae bacterium]
PAASVGAMLNAGACKALFGVSAASLSESHTALETLWGRGAIRLTEQLMAEPCPASRLVLFENALAAKLPNPRALHPAVAHALAHWHSYESVHDLVSSTGYSHRRFNALFRDAVGLNPKRYGRVLRFSALLDNLASCGRPLADMATDAGYSDQSHFQRDFREFAGMTPGEYRASAPQRPRHVPLG